MLGGRVGLVVASMCARDGATDAEVEACANNEIPTGIASPWAVDLEHEANQRCPDYSNRRHVVVSC